MQMKLIETNISARSVRMQFANDPNPGMATEWLEFEAPLDLLKAADSSSFGDPTSRPLVTVQLSLLHHMRLAIEGEIQRLSKVSTSDNEEGLPP